MESAKVYSPFILIQLTYLTICKACIIFHLDLVNECRKVKPFSNNAPLVFEYILATPSLWLWIFNSFGGTCNYFDGFVSLLFFWKNDNWELWENGWTFVGEQLVPAQSQFAKGFHCDNCKYATSTLLPWFWCHHFKFGNIWQSKFIQKITDQNCSNLIYF